MEIIQSILTKNPCYTAGRKITVKGLMLHSVGCAQPKASVFINNWNSASAGRACVHAFIDGNDGKVYQTLPWNHRGWHAGGGANNTHIGVEVCEPAGIKYTGPSGFTITNQTEAVASCRRTYESAVELFASLCKEYNLNPLADGVIISHAEGHKRGIASNHGDIDHYWKGMGLGYTMNGFRQDVNKAMGGAKPTASQTQTTSANSKYPNVPFMVDVKVSDLNYRDQPSMSGKVKGQTGKSRFTIIKVDGNWGFLKSEVGWIYLANSDYISIVDNSKASSVKSDGTYKIRVTADALRVRSGPGTNYKINKVIRDKGIYTIAGEQGDWLKLNSGDGWISKTYTKRV